MSTSVLELKTKIGCIIIIIIKTNNNNTYCGVYDQYKYININLIYIYIFLINQYSIDVSK